MMWKEKYKIGVDLIDTQHKELFHRVTTFIQTFREKKSWEEKQQKVKETMVFMQEYVIVHFNDEEKYQEQINYPDIDNHKIEHARFKQNVRHYVQRLENEGYNEALVQEFGGKLMAWLIMHVAGSDQKIGDYVESIIKNDYIDPLFDATREVFQIMLDIKTDKGNLSVVSSAPVNEENCATVALGVVGDLVGTIIFTIPEEMALKMVKTMSGMEVEEIDGFVSSALGEMANIIAGNALTKLTANELVCDIVPPKVYIGTENAPTLDGDSVLLMPLTTSIGNFKIHALLKKEELV